MRRHVLALFLLPSLALAAPEGWMGAESAGPPAPGEAELEVLQKRVSLKATNQDLSRVLNIIATFTGTNVGVPAEVAGRKVTVNFRGNVAQFLEVLGAQQRLRLWVQDGMLRIDPDACVRRAPEDARPAPSMKPVTLKARDQQLHRIANILAMFSGTVIPAIDASALERPVTLRVHDAGPDAVIATLQGALPGYEVFFDGPFLRVQPADACRAPAPTGDGWEAHEALLYGED